MANPQELTSIDDLAPAEYNPRSIKDAALKGLGVSLDRFGDISGITWNSRTRRLVSGHQRFRSLRETHGAQLTLDRGGKKIPPALVTASGERFPIRVVDWDEATEKAANVAANSSAIAGEWTEGLEAILAELGELDPQLFADLRMDDLLKEFLSEGVQDADGYRQGNTDPDALPDTPARALSQPGDLWRLGAHKLLCGDSTSPEDVQRLMAGERATLFATDPPYLVDYDGTNHPGKRPSKNKDCSEEYHDWDDSKQGAGLYEGFVSVAIEHAIDERAAWYCWHASRRQAMLEAVWEKFGAFVHQQIIWAKSRGVLTRSVMLWKHEPCFFGWIRKQKPQINKIEPYPSTVWEIPSAEVETTEHPTSKPVRCFGIPMQLHTAPGDICFEPFSGSGSQIMAAEQLQRRCFAVEREPRYVDVAIRRWVEFTGIRDIERNGEPFTWPEASK